MNPTTDVLDTVKVSHKLLKTLEEVRVDGEQYIIKNKLLIQEKPNGWAVYLINPKQALYGLIQTMNQLDSIYRIVFNHPLIIPTNEEVVTSSMD